jgi:hypothetical protein
MPRKTIVLRVFIASPSDVDPERALLESLVGELNSAWSATLGVMFELIKWETSVRPAFSSDPQAAINEQIGEDYDVFLGIFWGRLGTPTPRATSGSVEEFERAYKRLVQSGDAPEILLYFKDAPIAPSKIDVKQLANVQDFKRDAASKGGLYYSFDDLSSFESSVRSHLAAIAQKFSTDRRHGVIQQAAMPASTMETSFVSDEDDFGYMDYLEIYAAGQVEMTASMGVMTEAMQRVGDQVALRGKEMSEALPGDLKNARRMIKRTADDLDSFSATIRKELPGMSQAREKSFGALSKALVLRADFPSDDVALVELNQTLKMLLESASGGKQGIVGMRGSVDALPRMSKEINQAKRSMLAQLDAFIAEIDSVCSTVTNILSALERMD